MNVIVSNKQKEIIDNSNIDAIKDLNGLFSVDDLVNKFKNYFFSKMILDATSVVDFATHDVLQKLVDEIGSDRLIILLPSTPEPPDEFKKMLIELKIYNFSNKIEDVVNFINNPNTYENAMSTITTPNTGDNMYYVDNSIKEGEEPLDEEIANGEDHDDTFIDTVEEETKKEKSHTSLGDIMNSFNVYNTDEKVEDNKEDEQELDVRETEEVNETINVDNFDYSEVVNNENVDNSESNTTSSHVFLNMDDFDNVDYSNEEVEKKIIGFKNVTLHAGSTTLIYMLQKEAQKKNKEALSIEINKDDFKLFRNSKMISVKEDSIANTLSSIRENIVFVDLNDCQDISFCNEVVYLVEPSTIKLNKLMMTDKMIFNTLKDKKVILNKSMLSKDDIPILEKEANMKFYFDISAINERINNSIIQELFDKLLNS